MAKKSIKDRLKQRVQEKTQAKPLETPKPKREREDMNQAAFRVVRESMEN